MDFIPAGNEPDGSPLLAPKPGGATANTAVAAAKLGTNAAVIGKVGDDGFGRMMIDAISGYGACVKYIGTTHDASTTMGFVTLSQDGDREFTFARKPGADMLLSEDDIPNGLFIPGDILHYGSLALIPGTPSVRAHYKAFHMAKESGTILSFDPNIRFALWDDHKALYDLILELLPLADIVKISSDELSFIFGTDEEVAAATYSFAKGVSVVFITRGKDGAAVYTRSFSAGAPGNPVKAVDTTGAGDAFNGAMLTRFLGRPLDECLEPEYLSKTLHMANTAGTICVTRKGAMTGSPTLNELNAAIIDPAEARTGDSD